MAESGVAPKIFLSTTKAGVPYVAVLFTAAFGALGYLVVSNDGTVVFNWLLNIAATAGLVAWGSFLLVISDLCKFSNNEVSVEILLPFKAFFMPYSAYYAAIVVFTVALIQGFTVFWDFNATDFFTAYVSLIVFVVWWIMFHFFFSGLANKHGNGVMC